MNDHSFLAAPPENILKLDADLWELCSSGNYIKIEDAAPLVGMCGATLRNAIYRGTCPFGIGYDRTYYSDGKVKENGVARIPVLPFYNFMTQHWLYVYKAFAEKSRK